MSTIVQKNVSELKPHPRNEEIYGTNESIDELVEIMRKSGIVTTLTITDKKYKYIRTFVDIYNSARQPKKLVY